MLYQSYSYSFLVFSYISQYIIYKYMKYIEFCLVETLEEKILRFLLLIYENMSSIGANLK